MPKLLPYRLYNEDCFQTFDRLEDGSVDMVMVDPPYGTTACKWDSIVPLEPMWDALKRVIKSNGAIVMMASQPFTSKLIMSNLGWFRYEWIWEKERPTNIFLLKKQAGKVHENICVFYCKQPTYNPILEESKQPKNNQNNKSQAGEMNVIETIGKTKTKISSGYNPAKRYPRSVLKISRGTRNNRKFHPTQKPVALMEYLIETYTNKGETVLDFAMGSGTTGVACMSLGRKFIGCDNDVEHGYFDIADERIKAAWKGVM